MILTNVPISLRKPGVYTEFAFVDNVGGLASLQKRVVVVAEMSAAGTAIPNLPVQVFSSADGDAKCGAGSFAALGVRAAIATAQLKGGASPQFWICPVAEASGGVKAVQTITLTGPATQAGTLILTIAGRVINVGVNSGDSANTVAAAIAAAIQALVTTIPVVATVTTNVVTNTNVTKGVNGNDVVYALVQTVPGIGVALAQSTAGAGAAPIATALAALYDQRYHAICTSNHTTTDVTAEVTDGLFAWGFAQANYRFYFMGEPGSIGTAQTLQAAADYFPIHVISCLGTASLPIEIATAVATSWQCRVAPNANMDNDLLPLAPPNGANAYTSPEIESLLNGGCTPLVPAGGFCAISRMVTSQISISLSNSTPIEELREPAVPRTTSELAEQVAIKLGAGLASATETDDLLNDARDLIIEVDRTFEANGWIKNVDEFLGEISAEYATAPGGRMNTTNPHTVVPPLHQIVVETTSYQ